MKPTEPIKIFVEGVADLRFLQQFIEYHFNYSLDKDNHEVIIANGWEKIKTHSGAFLNEMRHNSDDGGNNLLIFDADSDYSSRFNDLEQWSNENHVQMDIFLFPNNHDRGDLESLLEHGINPNNKPVFDCWNDYEKSLKKIKIPGRNIPLTIPARKTKIYAYLEVLLGQSKKQKKLIKEMNRDYQNINHWDLNAPYLKDLKVFLAAYFS